MSGRSLKGKEFSLGVFMVRIIEHHKNLVESDGCGAVWLKLRVINSKRYDTKEEKQLNGKANSIIWLEEASTSFFRFWWMVCQSESTQSNYYCKKAKGIEYYYCNRSGYHKNIPIEDRQRQLNIKGSCRVNNYCTSSIRLKPLIFQLDSWLFCGPKVHKKIRLKKL